MVSFNITAIANKLHNYNMAMTQTQEC